MRSNRYMNKHTERRGNSLPAAPGLGTSARGRR